MNPRWFAKRADSEVEKGPYEAQAIRDAVRAGSISPDSLVRREDSFEWLPVRLQPELAGRVSEGALGSEATGARTEDESDDKSPSPRRATLLWVGAVVSCLGYATSPLLFTTGAGVPSQLDQTVQIGVALGRFVASLLPPLLTVGLSSLWRANRNERRRAKVFFAASLVLPILALLGGRA